MKKVIGVQCEVNITMDDDIAKGIGYGIKKTGICTEKIYDDLKEPIVAVIKKFIEKKVGGNSHE